VDKEVNNIELLNAVMDEVDERIRNRKSKAYIYDERERVKSETIGIKVQEQKAELVPRVEEIGRATVNSVIKNRNLSLTNETIQEIEVLDGIKKIKVTEIVNGMEENNESGEVSRCFIHVTEDGQEVYLMLYRRYDRAYTYEDIEDYLKSQNIIYGIKQDIICEMIQEENFYEDILVAEGLKPQEGQDGYFEFHFNTNPETKPIIFPDGSVDYNTLGKMELAEKDQLLVTYHGAIQATDGMNVFGEKVFAKEVKELKPLKGKGFEISTDGMQYYATIEGRVTFEDNKLTVTPVFTVEGDVDAATGDINFNGDVIVKGNVFANVTINATANITVNGHVEVANLIAGKDVLLKNGMQGNGSGTINVKGNVNAKFLEQTKVFAQGNINANAILNCEMESGKAIVVSGTRGAILGGYAKAVEKITAFSLGNKAGIQTKLIIGFEEDFKKMMSAIDEEMEDCKDKIFDTQKALNNLAGRISDIEDIGLKDARNEALRNKILYQTKLNELMIRKEKIIDVKERSANGSVTILGPTFGGSTIIINGISEFLKSECKNVTFISRMNEIRIFSNNI